MSSSIEELQQLPADKEILPAIDGRYSQEQLELIICDGYNPLDYRCIALNFLEHFNPGSVHEIVHRYIGFYVFSPTEIVKNFLIQIILDSTLDPSLKMECARCLYEETTSLGYRMFINLLEMKYETKEINKENETEDKENETKELNLPVPIKMEIFTYLFENEEHFESVSKLFKELILNPFIENEYRYKIIHTLQRKEKCKPCYIQDAYLTIVQDQEYNSTRYRILASQYLLLDKTLSQEKKLLIEEICIQFALDTELDYNLRADAADLLLRLSVSAHGLDMGREIITLLGESKGVKSVYTDRQNVHNEEIDKSAEEILLQLASIITDNDVDFDAVQQELESLAPQEVTKIRISLSRISLDNELYPGNLSLKGAFAKIWQYIQKHSEVETLKLRMCQELVEMSDSCGKGHLHRLVNVLSAFGFTLNIGWKNQIQANLTGRLTKLIAEITDEEQRDNILDQLTWKSKLEERKDFNLFFRDNLMRIREEMYHEFVETKYISHDQFEDCFRSALVNFEC